MVAIALGNALTPYHLYFMEDPIQIDTITTQADIAKRMPVSLGNGERFYHDMGISANSCEHGGPQYVRPDVALAGGLTHCKKIAAIAESYHCAVVTHNFLSPLGTAASVHLDASIPNFITQEYSKNDEHASTTRCTNARTNAKADIFPFPKPLALALNSTTPKSRARPSRP